MSHLDMISNIFTHLPVKQIHPVDVDEISVRVMAEPNCHFIH